MGFYDERIKHLFQSCPRIAIMSINSIFGKAYTLDSEIHYLDKELPSTSEEHAKYMDMLLEINQCRYHLEFQLMQDHMAFRMYEYAMRESLQSINETTMYQIKVQMPAQAVIFLTKVKESQCVVIELTLPNGKEVSYSLPCVSAAQPVEELIQNGLFILIPFQQVQLARKIQRVISDERKNSDVGELDFFSKIKQRKHKLAVQLYEYHKEVSLGLEKLLKHSIITSEEYEKLIVTLTDIEQYVTYEDTQISSEVKDMGENDYICWSDRMRAEGFERGEQSGFERGEQSGFERGEREGQSSLVKAIQLLRQGISTQDILSSGISQSTLDLAMTIK